MEETRFVVEAPRDGNVYVIDVTTSSTVIDVSPGGAYAALGERIRQNKMFRVEAEPVPVFYRTSNQASGIVSPNATVLSNPTQQGGIVHPNVPPPWSTHFQRDTQFIMVVTATGSGHLRFTESHG